MQMVFSLSSLDLETLLDRESAGLAEFEGRFP